MAFIKNIFNKVWLSAGCFLRKIYSDIFFHILWNTGMRERMQILYPDLFKDLYLDRMKVDDLMLMLGKKQWISDRLKGILDFEHIYPSILLAEEICTRYGRDCDDFARAWFEILKRRPDWAEVRMVLCTDGLSLRHSHFVTVARREGTSFWYLFSNHITSASLDYITWGKAVEEQKKPDNRAGVYYKDLIYKTYFKFTR